ncbi:anti-phage dCTP deaminase [Pseudomonas eucalypticola]|uniref:Cytidine deaminase n=1 Tax=Pseudomonas eucalypticola TaxID=2599595 RepID=A0A7D5HJD4_9PSED|nr:anti-phage dCTP deaminase [Pseudomonas eucalypticola]QKZ06786.1 cytidine deaminase [Pseudomonas eucalypticola]
MKFNGDLNELMQKLGSLAVVGEWRVVNRNQHQFRAKSKAIMNWFPSTGTVSFQGPTQAANLMRELVSQILFGGGPAHSPTETETRAEATADLARTMPGERGYFLDGTYADSEIVIGLVGAVGTDLDEVVRVVGDRLRAFRYACESIRISTDIISPLAPVEQTSSEYDRISGFMAAGNALRKRTEDKAVLALGVALKVNQFRSGQEPGRRAFVVKSLKHPEVVQRLRSIYSDGFFLLGVHADHARRSNFLIRERGMTDEQASRLIEKDADESDPFGQHTRDTYHLSDFFINHNGHSDSLKNQIWRVLDLLFGKPYVTPTFDEYAMFMAFSAALRSADLSRQVGAVLTQHGSIVATGANDVPKAHGGLYWPEIDPATHCANDAKDGRDYMRGEDSNVVQKKAIIDSILAAIPEHLHSQVAPIIRSSRIRDITEYGRVVHAEMEALLAGARAGVGTVGGELYCTTFPCHNCAKHIIAAGVKRVVYVEPYPKSKALEFHSDSISLERDGTNVVFEPFIGVGPRSFFNLFSTSLGSGYPIKRKTSDGQIVDWCESDAKLRTQLLPCSYMEREDLAAALLATYLEEKADEQ